MAAEDIGNAELPLPKGWVKSRSKKFGKPYYYHENTKCSIWVHPALLSIQQDVHKEETPGEKYSSISPPRRDQSFGKKAHSSSTIMDFLGLSGSVIENHSQRNKVNNTDMGKEVVNSEEGKNESASFTREQCFMLLGRKTQSASELQDFDSVTSNLVGSQIHEYNNKSDDRVARERSPIKSKQNSQLVKFGQKQIRTRSPEEKLSKTYSLYNHQLSKLQRKVIYETADSTKPINHIHNLTSSNHISKLPRLKPLLPKPTNELKQNRKRHSLESINGQQESHTQCKIMKTYNKETYNNNNSNNNDDNYSKIDSHKILTPAMKDVMAKRESAKSSGSKAVIHRKSSVKKGGLGKRIWDKSKELFKDNVTIDTPAMITVVKRKQLKIQEEKQKKHRHIHTFNDNEGKTKKKKTKKKTKLKEIESDVHGDEDIVNNILNKSINALTSTLKPLIKPRTKSQYVSQESQKTESSLLSEKCKENNQLLSKNEITLLDEVEDMEVDEAVHEEITKEIRELREDNVFEKPCLRETDHQHVLPFYSDPLYIVLDTNVLLGNLKFVSELKDYPIPGVGPPILVIPWMVFQELDSLKDADKRYHIERNDVGVEVKSHALSTLARKAINFIGGCLDGEHPRLKGQSAVEAGTPIQGFVEENNDDSIIHCALGLKTRSIHTHVVLLSNDRNLCNKSIVSCIKAFSKQNIISGLKNIFKNKTVIAPKIDFTSGTTSVPMVDLNKKFITAVQEDSNVNKAKDVLKSKKADECSCELQCILRDNLTKIIEYEMIAAYGNDLWLKIVKIKPPWTLEDVFVLLEKHWIAVFGSIVSRHLNKTVSKLKDMHLSVKTSPANMDSIKMMLKLSLAILSGFQTHSDYNGMLLESVKRVRLLLNKSNELLINNNELNLNVPSTSPSKQLAVVKSPGQNICNDQVSSYEKVRLTFDEIWNTANHYSALIFCSLNFPSPLTIDPKQIIPSSQESLLCLGVLIPCIFNLIKTIHNLISTPETESPNAQQNVINLLESIHAFSKEVMKRDCIMHPRELLEFCETSSTRDVFVQGLSQLDRLYAMLQQCDKFHRS